MKAEEAQSEEAEQPQEGRPGESNEEARSKEKPERVHFGVGTHGGKKPLASQDESGTLKLEMSREETLEEEDAGRRGQDLMKMIIV